MLRFKIKPTVPASVLDAIVKSLWFLHADWLWAKPQYVPVRIRDFRHGAHRPIH